MGGPIGPHHGPPFFLVLIESLFDEITICQWTMHGGPNLSWPKLVRWGLKDFSSELWTKFSHDNIGLLFLLCLRPLPENTLELFGLIPCPALMDPVYTTAAGELRFVNKKTKKEEDPLRFSIIFIIIIKLCDLRNLLYLCRPTRSPLK